MGWIIILVMDSLRNIINFSARSILFLVLNYSTLLAQEGTPYLTHYRLPEGVSNQNWGFVQSENGLMYILNRKGIFSFDGLQWENLGVAGRPIAITYSNKLFYCTDKGVGYFTEQEDGTHSQNLFLQSDDKNLFYKFRKIEGGILVVSPLMICKISTDTEIKVDTLYFEDRPEVFISDFFQLNQNTYHVKNRALVYLNKPDGGYEMLAGLPIGEDMVFSFVHGDVAFFGSTANKLYRFDGNRLTPFSLKDQIYLDASIMNGGVSISQNSFALSTLNGGTLIVNSSDGSTINTLNYFNGLPDDEIFSLGKDNDGGLWISHAMGITRADLKIPIKNFTHYSGIRGYLLSCAEFRGNLYVGSSEGLYYLAEERDYRTREITVQQRRPAVRREASVEPPSATSQEQTIEQKKKGFISRLFTRRDDPSEEIDVSARSTEVQSPLHEREIPPTRRRIYELQSISHLYKKVEGVDGKVRQILTYNDKLLAATNLGLYEISENRGRRVISGKNIVLAEVSHFDSSKILLGSDNGAFYAFENSRGWTIVPIYEAENQLVTSIVQISNQEFMLTNEFEVILLSGIGSANFKKEKVPLPGIEFSSPNVRIVDGKVVAFSSTGMYAFDEQLQKFEPEELFVQSLSNIQFSQPSWTWIRQSGGWVSLYSLSDDIKINPSLVNLLDNLNYFHLGNSGKLYVINSNAQVYRVDVDEASTTEKQISLFLKRILDKDGNLINPEGIELSYSNNALRVKISAPSFLKEGSVKFQYMISGLMETWSEWTHETTIDLPYFPPGRYTLTVRAKDIIGNFSQLVELPFHIKPPFWQTLWFIALCGVAVMLLFFSLIKVRERNLRKEKELLEQKVKERTKTIEEQKEVLKKQRDDLAKYNQEILEQKEEIEAQRDEIEIQRDQIFKQNDEITQSITYARKIQSAVMPSSQVVDSLLKEHFIMFRPRDIVSGDFFWMTEKNNRIVIVAADCTGHGVPGAFMSMMGVSFLNDIVNVEGVTQPDLILNTLREKITTTLSQTGKDGEARDGMDISVCVFIKNTHSLMFAGAYNPLYIVRKGELIEFKGNKMPVGIHPKDNEQFTLHHIILESGDNLYIFSDGYVSQFGGPDGRKFLAKPFKELLVSLYGKPMVEQQSILEDTMDKWQNAHDQVDDILVIGISII